MEPRINHGRPGWLGASPPQAVDASYALWASVSAAFAPVTGTEGLNGPAGRLAGLSLTSVQRLLEPAASSTQS